MTEPVFIRVAVPTPLDSLFDYRAPDGQPVPLPGCRVRVPFGNRRLVGVVIETGVAPDCAADRVKAVEAVLDDRPLIDVEGMDFLRWVARYYHHPLGEVLATALPNALARGDAAERTPRWRWFVTDAGRGTSVSTLRRAPRQALLLERLQQAPQGLAADAFAELAFDWRSPLTALTDKGLVEKRADDTSTPATRPQAPELREEQALAAAAVADARDGFKAFLLDGVTGSGKTEVYLHAAREVIEAGRQVLLLVPEIGLTPQLTQRFAERLGSRYAALHSGLTDRARLDAWLDVRSGGVDWVIGTRSAIFSPLPRPGLIIIDEEHDPSFKQQDGLRYSARDLALIRARDWGVPVLLGSATPSLESIRNAAAGQYTHLRLRERAGGAVMPRIRVQDIRNLRLHDGVSEPLLREIEQTLVDERQVLLFLNRRGYAPVLSCHQCGWVAECRRCDARMTLHQGERRLRCHHCGAEQRLEDSCPACGAEDLSRVGAGTERIEDILRQRFPDTPIERIDRDATRRKGELARKLDRAHRGESCILVGTQMIAKGHDFPNVGLVGIVNGDDGLFGLDFRSPERMAQLLVQVAGRAGRGRYPGEVVVQTRHPDHAQLQLLLRAGYAEFARSLLEERRMAQMPPFSHLALLRAESTRQGMGLDFLTEAARSAQALGVDGLGVWGPAHAPMEKRAGRFRAQLLIVHERRAVLHQALNRALPTWGVLPLARKVRWSLDVDPADLF